jgi:hypothetical protein
MFDARLVSMLACRQSVPKYHIGSYRPVEVLSRDHPLKGVKQELQVHGQCEELALDFLSEAWRASRSEITEGRPAGRPYNAGLTSFTGAPTVIRYS